MKYVIVSVRDRAANIFSQPMCVASVGQGVRSFGDAVNGPKDGTGSSAVAMHPEDFDLYNLGFFNDENGTFEPVEGGPRQIAVGKDMVISK